MREKYPSEKQIENMILSFLKARGVFCFKVETVGIFDQKLGRYRRKNSIHRTVGISDIIGIFEGRPLAIEIKSKKGAPTIHQKLFLAEWTGAGGIGFIARSIEDVAIELGLRI